MMRAFRLIDIVAKFQQKVRESIQAWLVRLWDVRGDGIFRTSWKAQNMSGIATHPALMQQLHGAWINLAQREVWPNEAHGILEIYREDTTNSLGVGKEMNHQCLCL